MNSFKELEYFALHMDKLKKCNPEIPFNLYIRLGDVDSLKEEARYAQIFSKTTGIDYSRLAHYIHKGVKELYVRSEDKDLALQFFSQTRSSFMENESVETQMKYLLHSTDQVLSEVFEGSLILKETAQETKVLVKEYISTLNQHPEQLKILLEMVYHGDDLYVHSLSVAVLSLFIAKNMGEFSGVFLENLTLGALYHDVGFIKLKLSDIDKTEDEVSKEDWNEYKKHPKLGLELVSVISELPQEVRYIVYQHHERYDGRGYPNQIKGESIFILSQVVCLADEYCKIWQSLNQFEGAQVELRVLRAIEARKNYFNPKVYEGFFRAFTELRKKEKNAA